MLNSRSIRSMKGMRGVSGLKKKKRKKGFVLLKKNMVFRLILAMVICLGLLAGCADQKVTADQSGNRDVYIRFPTLNALMQGYYDGRSPSETF